jgi:hypothetical protein
LATTDHGKSRDGPARRRIVGLLGSFSTFHADVVQASLGVKASRIDGLTGASHYNDLYLRRQNPNGILGPDIGIVNIRNTNLFGYDNGDGTPPETIGGIAIGTLAVPQTDDSQAINCALTHPVRLKKFFIQPGALTPLGQFVFPDTGMQPPAFDHCLAVVATDGLSVDWPGLRAANGGPVSGRAQLGPPVSGDFVPAGSVGLGYH